MFILTQVLFWSSMFGANSLLFDEKQMMEMYIESMKKFKSNLTDMLCMFSFFGMVHFHPYISVIVARGCSKLPAAIVLARDLKWPKYGYIMATGWVFCILFFTLQFMVMYRLSKQKMFLVIALFCVSCSSRFTISLNVILSTSSKASLRCGSTPCQ